MGEMCLRKPGTMPANGDPVIVAYRWSEDGPLNFTTGCWLTADNGRSGVIGYPDGCYLPCVGWLPMPTGEHDEYLPLHLRHSPIRGDE